MPGSILSAIGSHFSPLRCCYYHPNLQMKKQRHNTVKHLFQVIPGWHQSQVHALKCDEHCLCSIQVIISVENPSDHLNVTQMSQILALLLAGSVGLDRLCVHFTSQTSQICSCLCISTSVSLSSFSFSSRLVNGLWATAIYPIICSLQSSHGLQKSEPISPCI